MAPLPASRWKKGLLCVISVALFVSSIESVLGALSPLKVMKLYRRDEVLGWGFVPNRKVSLFYESQKWHTVTINRQGFRDDPFGAKRSGVKRILVLGDSYVSNIRIGDKEVFTEMMERNLKNVSVMNLGVDGYGQVQEYLLLKEKLEEFSPDLVVVVIYWRNDLTDNAGYEWEKGFSRPYARRALSGRDLEIFSPERASVGSSYRAPWFKTFYSYRFLMRVIGRLQNRLAPKTNPWPPTRIMPPELYLCRRGLNAESEEMYRILELLMLKIADLGKQKGVPTLFVLAPSIVQRRVKFWEKILEEWKVKEEDYDLFLPNRKIAGFAQEHNLYFLDLHPRLLAEEKRGHLLNDHWNADGNRVVAEEISAFVTSYLLK